MHFTDLSPGEQFNWDDISDSSNDGRSVLATPMPRAHTKIVDFTCIPQNLNAGSGMDGQCDKHSDDVYTLFMETATNYLCDICLEIQAKSENPVLIKVGTYGLKSSITNMRKHLLLHLPIWVAHCDHLGIVIDAKTVSDQVAAYWAENNVLVPATMQLKFKPFTMQGLSQRLMELIIAEDLAIQPISFVESERVIHLVLYLRQNLTKANILGCTTMSKVIIETWYCQMHELAKEIMGALGKISFTCDGWTDSTLYPFIAITVHWIKEVVITDKAKDGVKTRTVLQFCSDVLAFHELLQSHTGAHLGEAFLYLVNCLGLLKKITCDNASNNETMCGRLGYRLQGMGIDFDEALNHIRCFAHIIHLAVTAILDKIDKVNLAAIFAAKDGSTLPANHKPGVLTHTRGMVHKCWASSQWRIAFSKLVTAAREGQELLLIKDISNCWSSSHHMLYQALELQPQLEDFRLDKVHGLDIVPYILHKYEWQAIEVCEVILKVPHAFQHFLSTNGTPCLAYTISAFHAIIDRWIRLQEEYPDFVDIIQQGINKLEELFLLAVTTDSDSVAVIHPNIKLDWIEQNCRYHKADILDTFHAELQQRCPGGSNLHMNDPQPQPSQASSSGKQDDDWAQSILQLGRRNKRYGERTVEAEAANYLYKDTALASDDKDGLLKYWELNCKKYPTIFALTMDLLPIQGTSVPCEQLFSSSRHTKTDLHTRLGAELMKAIQILKNSIKQNGPLDFTKQYKRSVEVTELEAIVRQDEEHVPDIADPDTYRGNLPDISFVDLPVVSSVEKFIYI
ncbi:transposase [Moniliophthora roreri]|nr:transposase [Moniliophthora roreri]